jgi:hypothetical protein
MRITIELTETEGRATTIRPEGGAVPEDAPAVDGGPPPEALLIALGAVAAGETPGPPASVWVPMPAARRHGWSMSSPAGSSVPEFRGTGAAPDPSR